MNNYQFTDSIRIKKDKIRCRFNDQKDEKQNKISIFARICNIGDIIHSPRYTKPISENQIWQTNLTKYVKILFSTSISHRQSRLHWYFFLSD